VRQRSKYVIDMIAQLARDMKRKSVVNLVIFVIDYLATKMATSHRVPPLPLGSMTQVICDLCRYCAVSGCIQLLVYHCQYHFTSLECSTWTQSAAAWLRQWRCSCSQRRWYTSNVIVLWLLLFSRPWLERVSRRQPSSASQDGTAPQPAWLAFDRQVLKTSSITYPIA
jgi:hypothetical protein